MDRRHANLDKSLSIVVRSPPSFLPSFLPSLLSLSLPIQGEATFETFHWTRCRKRKCVRGTSAFERDNCCFANIEVTWMFHSSISHYNILKESMPKCNTVGVNYNLSPRLSFILSPFNISAMNRLSYSVFRGALRPLRKFQWRMSPSDLWHCLLPELNASKFMRSPSLWSSDLVMRSLWVALFAIEIGHPTWNCNSFIWCYRFVALKLYINCTM